MSSESPRKLGQMLAAYFPEEDGSVTYIRFKNNEPGIAYQIRNYMTMEEYERFLQEKPALNNSEKKE
ncbi:hypothetical protein TVAGG3_0225300 [Trichomonas vaginalis G3]|uniref:uncharacterized protein n=1 Tax=Trichomonas vaginalis (strain ATCC PRA-98 / G3) TaxID=412133 RepID=UPI0021E57BAF|nr:hypothetical protein TVAGG3_0024720 [Trichomonas vaginalis G3]XP_051075770.1 uncharacterized protein TVAGG3_1090630 [Trichomonas vaginalis G3]XP_051075988.1 uncharacterized protein TVAGG3_1084090 [Trichomonas vaginalis G3]XP_051076648.1 uncharacterized protein TVAGG3_1064560 [Trichomonas vaginalis G3]XP_051077556.1 hypothetical protein TVAGG3_0915410 [Trichomonas vaginalis G3]XP_051077599.1 hypothetical protein TVAGG3_0916220 [Trichomonas vaginalis G3]XP_051078076.1 hypothetical protein TV